LFGVLVAIKVIIYCMTQSKKFFCLFQKEKSRYHSSKSALHPSRRRRNKQNHKRKEKENPSNTFSLMGLATTSSQAQRMSKSLGNWPRKRKKRPKRKQQSRKK
jgi:hypothetical protein